MKRKILVITPVKHIKGVSEILESIGSVTYMDDPSAEMVMTCIHEYDAIYTNPNKSQIYIDKEILSAGKNLKVICTASTGTNHIDKLYAENKSLSIISLTEERDVISKISSTAEHAFALTLSAIRNVVAGHESVLKGEWDYTKFIGHQINALTIGVIGYGRLGRMYANYAKSFGAKVLVYDPYINVKELGIEQVSDVKKLLIESDIISLHVHVSPETIGMFDALWFESVKSNFLLVNTARGEIVNENALVNFLRKNPDSRVATDVLADEIRGRDRSPLLAYAKESNQVLITPHIGGMTIEAQELAYSHAARLMHNFFLENNN